MHIFTHHQSQLNRLKELPFKLEKEIQNLFEQHLKTITGCEFIQSEVAIKNNRIDTLAFDTENNSFVIIEYKRDRNYSVIDQGVSYLNLMLEYKADFIIEHNESQKANLKRSDVDWSQSKILFVAPSFTDFQKQSSNFKDLPIELWEIKKYEKEVVVIHPVRKSKSAPSIKQVQGDNQSEIAKVSREIKVYTEDDHLEGKSDAVKELYEIYKTAILNLDNGIDIEIKKHYIVFKKEKNIIDIQIQNKGLKMWINAKKGDLNDSKKIAKDVSSLGHLGNGDYQIQTSDTQNLEYTMSLVKQVL